MPNLINHSLALDVHTYRSISHPIDEIFLKRWSPRAFSNQDVTTEELMSLFEAARFAPSSYNNQPWRFIYARRGTPHFQKFFNWMVEFNQGWTKNAPILIVIVSKKTFDHNGTPSITHSFDTGSAWENLALQATLKGLIAHGMQGFDYERAQRELNLSEEYQAEAMVAVGHPGSPESLSHELREREFPSSRKPLSEIAFEGEMKI